MNISDKIIAVAEELGPLKGKLDGLQKQLAEKTKAFEADTDSTELLDDMDTIGRECDELQTEIGEKQALLDKLRTQEKRIAQMAEPATVTAAPSVIKRRKEKPGDGIIRFAVVKALAYQRRASEAEILEDLYPDDERVKSVFRAVTKTAAPVATTTATTYAAELVREDVRGLLEEVEATSVAAALALRASASGGMLINFDGAETVRIPVLAGTAAAPTEPAWVREAGAIPVGSLSIGSQVLSRYKLAEILVSTMELVNRSIVDIEALFRRTMTRAYSRVLDNALMDNGAAVAGIRPAGLLNGITVTAGDTTGGLASLVADIAGMQGELYAANPGAVPVLILNKQDAANLAFVRNDLGIFVLQQTGVSVLPPIVSSEHLAVGTAYMIDISSLAIALDAPDFMTSQHATVVMANADDTAPTMADDGSTGAVGTQGQVPTGINVIPSAAILAGAGAGYGARSMYQTYSEAVRMVAPATWALLRAGTVAGRSAIKWAA